MLIPKFDSWEAHTAAGQLKLTRKETMRLLTRLFSIEVQLLLLVLLLGMVLGLAI